MFTTSGIAVETIYFKMNEDFTNHNMGSKKDLTHVFFSRRLKCPLRIASYILRLCRAAKNQFRMVHISVS